MPAFFFKLGVNSIQIRQIFPLSYVIARCVCASVGVRGRPWASVGVSVGVRGRPWASVGVRKVRVRIRRCVHASLRCVYAFVGACTHS